MLNKMKYSPIGALTVLSLGVIGITAGLYMYNVYLVNGGIKKISSSSGKDNGKDKHADLNSGSNNRSSSSANSNSSINKITSTSSSKNSSSISNHADSKSK